MKLNNNKLLISKLIYGKSNIDFKNNKGRLLGHRGGGHKKKYRIIDFARKQWNCSAIVHRLDYDPNRTSLIALLSYSNGTASYILAPYGLKPGDIIYSGFNANFSLGNVFYLWQIPLTTLIHNIELYPGKGGQIARAAGSFAKIIRKDSKYAVLLLKSGEERIFDLNCLATIGRVSNAQHNLIDLKKAGRSRWKGRRPVVRGVVKNPVDHPHGGGEGKTSGGRPSVSPWGKITKGMPTRRKNNKTSVFISKFRNKTKSNLLSLI